MKKSSLIATAALATLGLSAPSYAQENPFKDVPADHWAYAAIEKLAGLKIVIGDPDGLYHGKRTMTRYEFAVALARLLDILDSRYAKIDHMHPAGTPGTDTSGFVTKEVYDAGIKDLDDRKANKSDLPDFTQFAKVSDLELLRKMVGEFQTELTALGVDVDGVKKRLTALETRVTSIENDLKRRARINGTFNTYSRSNYRTGRGTTGITDKDGFLVTGGPGTSGGLLADTRVLHDLDLDIKAQPADNVSFEGTLTLGNYLSYLAGGNGIRSSRGAGGVNQDQTQTLWKAVINTGVDLRVLGNTGLQIGRIPTAYSNYTFKMPDPDFYFDNIKTDRAPGSDFDFYNLKPRMGTVPTDGLKANFKLGSFGLTAQAAKINPITTGTGLTLSWPVIVGASRPAGPLTRALTTGVFRNRTGGIVAEQFAAVNANFNISKLNLGVTGMMFGGPTNAVVGSTPATLNGNGNFDQVNVYGADASLGVKILGLGTTFIGHYAMSDTRGTTATSTSNTNKVQNNNTALDVSAQAGRGNVSVTGGYRRVDPLFGAPGAWARVGSYQNPTDIQGGYGNLSVQLGSKLVLMGSIQSYEGIGKAGVSALTNRDEINNVGFGVKWNVTTPSSLELGVENTEYTVAADTTRKPREQFINIGYNYAFNPVTNFRLLYQIIDFDGKGNAPFLGGAVDPAFNRQKGGVVAGQFSVRF